MLELQQCRYELEINPKNIWKVGNLYSVVYYGNLCIDPKIKIMGYTESALGIEIISQIILYMNKSPLLVKIAYISVHTSHAKC